MVGSVQLMLPHLVHRDTWWFLSMTTYGLGNLNNLYTHHVYSLSWDAEGQRNGFSLKENRVFACREGKHANVSSLGTFICSAGSHSSVRRWNLGTGLRWLVPLVKHKDH